MLISAVGSVTMPRGPCNRIALPSQRGDLPLTHARPLARVVQLMPYGPRGGVAARAGCLARWALCVLSIEQSAAIGY